MKRRRLIGFKKWAHLSHIGNLLLSLRQNLIDYDHIVKMLWKGNVKRGGLRNISLAGGKTRRLQSKILANTEWPLLFDFHLPNFLIWHFSTN